jgi:hypothetical protein
LRSPAARLRATASRTLSLEQKLWLSRLKHGELPWQHRLADRVAPVLPRAGGDRTHADSATVERAYDARRATLDNLQRIRDLLTSAGLDFVELPRMDVYDPVLVIDRTDVRRALSALRGLGAAEGWQIEAELPGRRVAAVPAVLTRTSPDEILAFRAYRRLAAPNGRILSTSAEAVRIQAWVRIPEGVDRVDGSTHVPGTLHRRPGQRKSVVEYLTPQAWRRAVERDDRRVMLEAPHLLELTEPVDLVYTWVDGSDPEWLARKNRTLHGVDPESVNETAVSESRFTSRDELMYSLRSVEMYAGWYNHIYLVTDRQVPDWLRTDHPRLTVVDHREIFTDPAVLPVFNSHAIESQLHHIPGLSEHYVYMNDDVFFCRPTSPELFFTGNGLSKFFPSKAVLDIDEPSVRDLPVMSAAKNNRRFMIDRHGRTVTNKFKHTPHPQLRSVLEEMEAESPNMFAQVAASRVRHPSDYSIPSALYHFHAYACGRAVEGAIRYGYMDIARADAELYLMRLSRRSNLDVLCLNDTNTAPEQQELLDGLLGSFLENRFPVPSSFETP